MSQRFFEELASMKLAQSYPEAVNALDRESELRRIILHYKLNWLYMSRNIKDKLQAELTAHQEKRKGTKGSLYQPKPKGAG